MSRRLEESQSRWLERRKALRTVSIAGGAGFSAMTQVVFVAVMVLAFILMAVVVLSTGGALSDVGAALAPDTSTLAGYFTFGAVVSQVFYALMQTVLVTIMTGVALDTYKAFVAHHGAGMD